MCALLRKCPSTAAATAAIALPWNHVRIRQHLGGHFGACTPVPMPAGATATDYAIAGPPWARSGIIAAYSRTFCGTCNRIRLTAEGGLKTCLYDQGVLDVRALLRGGSSDEELRAALVARLPLPRRRWLRGRAPAAACTSSALSPCQRLEVSAELLKSSLTGKNTNF